MDRMIKYINSRYSNVTLFYSTPGYYFDTLKQLEMKWPTNYYDMLPYADEVHCFWSGYFTSRANAKHYVRRASANLHSSSKLYAL